MMPNWVRYLNKRFLNKLMWPLAGRPRLPFALVEHTGRKTGRIYQTPVIVEPFEDGFVFALTYGRKVDWYRNVLAANGCRLYWHQRWLTLTDPDDVEPHVAVQAFPRPFNRILSLTRMKDYFRLHAVEL